jgi:hypothetical protein
MPGELNSERQEANAGHRNDRRAQIAAHTNKHAIDQETPAPLGHQSQTRDDKETGPGTRKFPHVQLFFSGLVGNK